LKDYLKAYAITAFRFYARNGRSAEEYKKKIHDDAIDTIKRREIKAKGSGGSPTEKMMIEAENMISFKTAEIKDMEAVEKTIRQLETMRFGQGEEIIKAIEFVYFKDPYKELLKGQLCERIHTAESSIPASERSIYRGLRKARDIFAIERGLRIEK
jgi:hypothetical protein